MLKAFSHYHIIITSTIIIIIICLFFLNVFVAQLTNLWSEYEKQNIIITIIIKITLIIVINNHGNPGRQLLPNGQNTCLTSSFLPDYYR